MNKDNLLIELFTEELPPDSIEILAKELGNKISQELLSKKLINEIDFKSFATPRRLAVYVKAVNIKAEDETKLIKIMPYSVGFDEDNKPTQPLIKKLESIDKAIKIKELEVIEEKNKKFIYISKKFKGGKLEDELNSIIKNSLQQLSIKKI